MYKSIGICLFEYIPELYYGGFMLEKRILAGVIAIIMFFTVTPQNAFANYNTNINTHSLKNKFTVEDVDCFYDAINFQSKDDFSNFFNYEAKEVPKKVSKDTSKEVSKSNFDDAESSEIFNIEFNKNDSCEDKNAGGSFSSSNKDLNSQTTKQDQNDSNISEATLNKNDKLKSGDTTMEGVLVEGDILLENPGIVAKSNKKEQSENNFKRSNKSSNAKIFSLYNSRNEDENFINPLSEAEYDSIVKELLALDEMDSSAKKVRVNVDGYGITVENLSDIVGLIFNSQPELFFYEETYSYRYKGENILDITFSLENSIAEISRQQSIIDKEVKKFEQLVSPKMTPTEIVLLVHDYLIANTVYDYDGVKTGKLNQSVFDIYGVFGEKLAVCQGYALATEYLLNKYGIQCGIASSENENHAWNVVKIEDDWYHLDTTWDDPVYDNLGTVNHKYLLVSQEKLLADKHCKDRYDFVTSVKEGEYKNTKGDKYDDEYWIDSEAYIHQYEGKQYYMDKDDFQLKVYDKKSGSHEVLVDEKKLGKKVIWQQKSNANSYWKGNFSKIVGHNNNLYLSTPNEIYKVDLETENCWPIKVFDTEEQYIYGIGEFNNAIVYVLKDSPKNDEDIYHNEKVHSTNISIGCNTKITKVDTDDGEFTVEFRPVKFYDNDGKLIKMNYRVYYRLYNEEKYKYKDTDKNQIKIKGLHRNYPYYVKIKPYYEAEDGKLIEGDLTKTEKIVTNPVNLYIPKGKIVKLSYTGKYNTVKIKTVFPELEGGKVYCQLAYKKATDKAYKVKSFKNVDLVLSGLKRNTKYNVGVRYVYQDDETGKKAISKYSTTKTFKTKAR